MVLNAYGSAVLKSELDFPIWASVKHGIENPVKKELKASVKEKLRNMMN